MNAKRKRVLTGIGFTLLVLIVGYLLIRPVHLRWGATHEELAGVMPGDLAGTRWTRAITIKAPPQDIWPWMVQWGQGRGGWYSYDWLENLFGFDIHTADSILPDYQDTRIGDPICMAPNVCASFVSVMVPNRWFGWQTVDEAGKPVWTFTLGLFPLDDTRTRLVVRESFDPSAMPPFVIFLIEIPDVVMEQKMLHTLKQRAEGLAGSTLITLYEILVWLAACAAALAAWVLSIQRPDQRIFLVINAVSIWVTLALTFLFPPFWLRGVLVVGLWAALGWFLRIPDNTPV